MRIRFGCGLDTGADWIREYTVVTKLRAGRPEDLGSIPDKGRRFSLPSLWSDRLWRLSWILCRGCQGQRGRGVKQTTRPIKWWNWENEFAVPSPPYMYLRHTWHGTWLNQYVPLLLLPSENLSSHLVIVLGRYEFRVIVQKPFTVRYSVTNTVYKVSLREPVLTHWRYFTRSYVPSRIEQSLECPSFLFLLSLVLGFIIWRVCIMSTCQTHLFPCQCFDQYWFELQLNR